MEELTFSRFIREFNEADKEMNIIYHRLARHYRLSDSVFWVLYLLGEARGPMTQTKLCSALFLSKQTVNSALKKLESEGYITLTPAGAHTKNISLTKSGTKLCEQTVDKVIEAECAALGNMTDEESENMTALMKLYSVLLKNQTAKI